MKRIILIAFICIISNSIYAQSGCIPYEKVEYPVKMNYAITVDQKPMLCRDYELISDTLTLYDAGYYSHSIWQRRVATIKLVRYSNLTITKFQKVDNVEELSIIFRDYCYKRHIITASHKTWIKFKKDAKDWATDFKNVEWYALRFLSYSYEYEVSRGDHSDWLEFMLDPAYYDSHVIGVEEYIYDIDED